MPNNLSSNITRKVMRAFIPAFEKERVLSKTIDTQLFSGKFDPQSGEYVDIKRPHQYLAQQTSGGDISGGTYNSLIAGKATAQVQNYITVPMTWTNKEESLELDQLEEILKPAAEECVTVLETNLYTFMMKNSGLSVGSPDLAVDAWADLAQPMSLAKSIGFPAGGLNYVMNPFTIAKLANIQSGLSASDKLVQTAWESAQIASPFAGLKAIASACMGSRTSMAGADRSGTLSAAPTATYVGAKDTMTQVLTVAGLTAATTIKAGDVLEFPGTGALARSQVHRRTRSVIFDETGTAIPWRCTVVSDALMDGAGAGTVTVTGPAIFEANGQYNNISAALANGDVFTVLGTASKVYQPNLWYHRSAFVAAFVKLPKLYSTDTIATTADGISIRVSKYSDGSKNTQSLRFDLLPAFGVMNPFLAGHGYGGH